MLLKKFDDLINFLARETSVGDRVELTIRRDGQEQRLKVELLDDLRIVEKKAMEREVIRIWF